LTTQTKETHTSWGSAPRRERLHEERLTKGRRPPWLRVRPPGGETYERVRKIVHELHLHTVCEEAMCPNLPECWGHGTATFLILGDICTRSCGFCKVKTGRPGPVDEDEPLRVAEAVKAMGLRHAVVTSVTRDDLPDGGAHIFARTIAEIKRLQPGCTVEVLIPDFKGDRDALKMVLDEHPEVLNHNVETVPRLYRTVRPQAKYERSLAVLRMAREMFPNVLTKSGIMVGLGEEWDEILEVMDDLRENDVDILTIGQYLQPSRYHLPISRYYTPEEFDMLHNEGMKRGFLWVESGPLVRSSFHAGEQVRELLAKKNPA
jgi:lipoic acid synthetase